MKLLVPTLKKDSQGGEVKNLHYVLYYLAQKINDATVNEYFTDADLKMRYTKEVYNQLYDEATLKMVSVFQIHFQLQNVVIGTVDAPTAKQFNTLLKEYQGLDIEKPEGYPYLVSDDKEGYKISGQVTDAYKKGMSNIVVSVLEYDINLTTQIAKVLTDEKGNFFCSFLYNTDFQSADGLTNPDIVFQLFTTQGIELPISDVLLSNENIETAVERLSDSNLSPIVVMNMDTNLNIRIVQQSGAIYLTEFERLVALLTPFMRKIHFADLKEDEKNFQISFLSKETGIEKAKIESLKNAFMEERATELPAWAFFGLANYPLAVSQWLMPVELFVPVLKMLQPSTENKDLKDLSEKLIAYAQDKWQEEKVIGLKAYAGDALKLVFREGSLHDEFFKRYAKHEEGIEKFWESLANDPNFKDKVPAIQLTLQLSELTMGNIGLTQVLQAQGITETQELVYFSDQKWQDLITLNPQSLPDYIGTEETPYLEKVKLYTNELQERVEFAFPTEVIKTKIASTGVKTFLEGNPKFDFTETPLEMYLQEHGEAAFMGVDNKESVVQELRQTQRLYAITESATDTKYLSDFGFQSAYQIGSMPVEEFVQVVSTRIPIEAAEYFHRQSLGVNERVTFIGAQLRETASNYMPPAVGSNPNPKDLLPNWENFFGQIETCECQHCKSVYSPAAYFVDLLHILLGQKNGNARLELFRRRPDLKYTQLTCEHTHTLIPYIDLVNEVLETYVAQKALVDAYAKTATNDTSIFTASELSANPQHPNPASQSDADAAYLAVSKATFPLSLPFDLSLETGRQFLLGQNSSRYELMTTFGNADSTATIAEGLGLSEFQYRLLVGKKLDNTDWNIARDLFGYSLTELPDEADLGMSLKYVKEFMERTTIDYTDLISLVETRFLNANQNIVLALEAPATILPTDLPAWQAAHACDLAFTRLVHKDASPLTSEELANFNRFIRLWKKLGCTIPELDILLSGLGNQLNPILLRGLSGLWQLMKTIALSFEQAALLVSNISTIGKNALYNRLFLNKAMLQIDDKFDLNATKTDLINTTEALKDHKPALLAAFSISEKELSAIADLTSIDLTKSNTLNLVNISKIYRYDVMAKINGFSILDFMTLLRFAPHKEWTTVAEWLKNQTFFDKIKQSNLSASILTYLFEDVVEAGNTLPPKNEIIEKSANDLHTGLTKITASTTPKEGTVTAEFLKLQLGLILEEKNVTKLLSILDGSNLKADPNAPLPTITAASDRTFLQNPLFSATLKKFFNNYLVTADLDVIANTTTVLTRYSLFWRNISVRLIPILKDTFIKQHITAVFNTEAMWATFLLSDTGIKTAVLDNNTNMSAYKTAHIQMFKCLWLVENFKLIPNELTYFQANNIQFNNFDWKNFTTTQLTAWLRVYDYSILRDSLPPSTQSLIAVFETAQRGGDIAKSIVAVTGFDLANSTYFVSKRNPTDFKDEKNLILLQNQIRISQAIGVSIEKLEKWSTDNLDADQAKGIKHTLKSLYNEASWIDISTKIHNQLRNLQRDALVAYLLQMPEIKSLKDPDGKPRSVKNANDLYEYFLIDVEMDACMKTSRLKQAIASVQLFVQRCVMNLEPVVHPSQIGEKQYNWMKNYRVWEANRKVFLYPENWIEPELRDNKTPFFKELESELLQSEITNESAERALINYLHKLDEVARLDICGMYEDKEALELHVFGRSFNTPPQYFYRKLNLVTQEWTAWDRVQVDIQSEEEGNDAGVHLIPVVWNRRLYLFWPIFTEKTDRQKIKESDEEFNKRHKKWEKEHNDWQKDHDNWEKEKKQWSVWYESWKIDHKTWEGKVEIKLEVDLGFWSDTVSLTSRGPEPQPPIPLRSEPEEEEEPRQDENSWAYYEIKMAWSEYKQNRWSTKKVSQNYVQTIADRYGARGYWDYRFLVKLGSSLNIEVLFYTITLGKFEMACNDQMMAISFGAPIVGNGRFVIRPKQVNFYQGLVSLGSDLNWNDNSSTPMILIDKEAIQHDILGGSDKAYKLQFSSNHDFIINSGSKFFYQDQKRNYYVEPQVERQSAAKKRMTRREKAAIVNVEPNIDKFKKAAMKFQEPTVTQVLERFSAQKISTWVQTEKIDSSMATQLYEMPTIISLAKERATYSHATKKARTKYKPTKATKLVFKPFFHAYVCAFIKALNKNGIEGLLNLTIQYSSDLTLWVDPVTSIPNNNFSSRYKPNPLKVKQPFPFETVDFTSTGAFSLYNWELFFHIPMLIANRLSKNQKFEEATRWYHFIFNPTTHDGTKDVSRYWRVLPLRNSPTKTLQSLMQQLNNAPDDIKRKELEKAIETWRENPFNPHLIARMRIEAYKKNVLMKYLDNTLAQIDNLLRQNTFESRAEATQYCFQVANFVGKVSKEIPSRGTIKAMNYDELEKIGLNAFSNARVLLETTFPFFNIESMSGGAGASAILSSTSPSDYFCIPNNAKLLAYRDTIADRLFKLRHCQNIDGVEQQLALFEPPIDPALLVQATAKGIDIGSILADLNAPLSPYRFTYIHPKALEMCSVLMSFGNTCLSILEKKDNEALAMMRTQQESTLLDLVQKVKKMQIKEAQRNREGLEKTKEIIQLREAYYEQLIAGGLNDGEQAYQLLSGVSLMLSLSGQTLEMAASTAHQAPDSFLGALAGAAGGAISLNKVSGGEKSGQGLSAMGRFFGMYSSMTSFAATMAQNDASFKRRADEWKQQKEVAQKELKQIDKPILVSIIREAIAEQELTNHEKQVENARQVEDFYRNKFTQEELYGWMMGEISTIYFQCYQLVYDWAKIAEKACRHELGISESNFIQFGAWDSFRKGLMSGERLYLQLKQMEKFYLEQNKREFELTKHISLALINPMAILQLREKGICQFDLPEEIFDLDYQGHYFRRIKTVSLSIPCIAGTYTTINATLRLMKNSLRFSKRVTPKYASTGSDDDRFTENPVGVKTVALSSAQNDNGMFDFNFRDERYLPFEGAGAVSTWVLELTTERSLRQFDYNTISDAILHVRYTAREDGALRTASTAYLKTLIDNNAANNMPFRRLFSLRHDFPTAWHRFLNPTSGQDNICSLDMIQDRFPFFAQGKKITISSAEFHIKALHTNAFDMQFMSPPTTPPTLTSATATATTGLQAVTITGSLVLANAQKPESFWQLKLKKGGVANFSTLTEKDVEDVFLVVDYILA